MHPLKVFCVVSALLFQISLFSGYLGQSPFLLDFVFLFLVSDEEEASPPNALPPG